MGTNLRLKKGKRDEFILKLLREGTQDYLEFRKKCLDLGIPSSTFDNRIKSLMKFGLVKRENIISIVDQIPIADANDVKDCITILKNETNKQALLGRLDQLRGISKTKRILHLPNVLNVFEYLTGSDKISRDPGAFEVLMNIFYNIFEFEDRYPSPDSEIYLQELLKTPVSSAVEHIKNTPYFPGRQALHVMRYIGRREVVEILFDKIMKYNESIIPEVIQQISFTFERGGKLHQTQSGVINQKIDELLKSENDNLIGIGRQIRPR